MFGNMNRNRSHECVSDLVFDRWLAGDLGNADEAHLSQHVRACARCRERYDCLSRDRERFAASAFSNAAWLDAWSKRRDQSRAHRARAWAAAASLAAAASALLAFQHQTQPSGGERVKGGQHLTFYVKRGERVGKGAAMLPLRPGDKLRFAYTTPARKYLVILSLDGDQRASIYYPDQPRAAAIGPGVDVLLPSAVELDARTGEERIIGLFCDDPLPVAPLRAELETKRAAFRAPTGCSAHLSRVNKETAAAR